jgi:chromosome segregation ATPase
MDALDEKIDGTKSELLARTDALDKKIESTKNELLAEIKRLDSRIEGLEREVRVSLEIRERLAAVEAKLGISRQ